MTAPLAHGSAHWLETVVYVVPLFVVGAWLAVSSWRERRRKRREEP